MAATPHNADANLLFGVLALQMDFITRDQLIAGMQSWVNDKKTPLAEHLVRGQALNSERRQLLEPLVAEHIRQHANDPQQSLAAVRSADSIRRDLKALADPDIEASLVALREWHSAASRSGDSTQTFVGNASSEGKRFRILRPHARGGLGEVFVAEDQELHREVALKEILSSHADDPLSRSRFLLEAEITGGLEHPGIVPVYGLGQYNDGRPFYAMRFVRGDSLKEAVDRCHASSPHIAYDSAEFRKLLGRFVDVCNAIEYAHSRGVLHRDLKPGNIMLGKYGETLVVDWGLAKAHGREDRSEMDGETTLRPSSASGSSHTQMGEVVGTPAYMSPEQAGGRLDDLGVTSDVYSLGATLYYLLTGCAPFNKNEDGDILRKVERGEFPTPRSLRPEIPKPLEAICLRAMSTRPQARYASPNSLADDVEHYLADEPLAALPDSLGDRMNRFARRNRTLVRSAAAALLVVAVVSTVAALVVNEQRRQNAKLANDNGELAEAKGKIAVEKSRLAEEKEKQSVRRELNFNRALEAVDKMLTRVGANRLAEFPEFGPVRKAILEDALKLYEQLLEEEGDSPELRLEIARASRRVAAIHSDLGDQEAAIAAFQKAIEYYSASPDPIPLQRHELATVHGQLGELLSGRKRLPEAIASYRAGEALLVATAKDGNDEDRRLFNLYFRYVDALEAAGQKGEATEVLRKAIEIGDRILAKDPKDPTDIVVMLGGVYDHLARILETQPGNQAEVERLLKRFVELKEPRALDGRLEAWDRPLISLENSNHIHSSAGHLAHVYQKLSRLLRRQGREAEAKTFEEKLLELRPASIQKIELRIAQNLSKRSKAFNLQVLAQDSAAQARLLRDRKSSKDAIVYYRKAIDAYKQLADGSPEAVDFHISALELGLELAACLLSQPDGMEEGKTLLAGILSEVRSRDRSRDNGQNVDVKLLAAFRNGAQQLRFTYNDMATCELVIGEALALTQLMNEAELASDAAQDALQWCHHNLGDVLFFSHNKPAEAADHYEQARVIQERLIAKQGINAGLASALGWSCQNGAAALLITKPDAKLVTVAVRGVEVREYLVNHHSGKAADAALIKSANTLGQALAFVSDADSADLEKAAALAEARTQPSPGHGIAWRILGIVRYRQGKYTEAVKALESALAAELDKPAEPAIDHFFLAMALAKTHKKDEAQRSLDAGREWVSKNRPAHAQFRSLGEQAGAVVAGK